MSNAVNASEDVEESFKLFDIDGNGKITKTELMAVMRSVGKVITEQDATEILEMIDEDGDGEINFEEYKNVMHKHLSKPTLEEDLLEAFSIFDTDNDGFISSIEVQLMFEKLGESVSLKEASEIMKDCDSNSDGLIDYEEFKTFHQKMNEQQLSPGKEVGLKKQ